jgi:hypothetical protein
MRWLGIIGLCLGLTGTLFAQDTPTPYEIALARIQEVQTSGATELNLSGMGLEALPPEIGDLANLQYLHLLSNQLTELPREIGNLTNLQFLSLVGNQLTNLPLEIGNLITLQHLSLSYNQLTELPPEIGNLTNLQTLFLDYNQLQIFPPEIGNLTNLRYLDLSNNQLISLPAEIGNLINLEELELTGNQLTTLPSEFRNLVNLCRLDLADNQLQHLPYFLGELDALRPSTCGNIPSIFYVDGNPLISPPPEVVAQGTDAILDYLNEQAAWHVRQLIAGGATGAGVLVALMLGLRWRYAVARGAGRRGDKKKRAA